MENIPAIISAIGTIIAAYFAYNQYTRNKITDLKVERFKANMERDNALRADQCGFIYGEIADLKREVDANRVYIIQPHPLGNESLLSIYFEIKDRGVEAMKPHIQQLPLADIPKFYSMLTQNDYITIHNIGDVEDSVAHSIFSTYGANQCFIRKLYNRRRDWNGSIFVEYTTDTPPYDDEEMQEVLKSVATAIQNQLPEFKTA